MGKSAHINEIHPNTITKALNGEVITVEELKFGINKDLDKSWMVMHSIFQEFGPPLKYTIIGDSIHPLSPEKLDDLIENKSEFYIGFMSPSLVKDVSKELEKISSHNLNELYKKHDEEFDEYNMSYFSNLREIYSYAAKNESALYICASI